MSGHSKWANIKHRKAIQDAKKASLFTKLSKNITIAAKSGGNPDTNFALRLAIEKAKQFNLPKENIEKAIKRGTGELKDQNMIEEVVYEAYGPGQVAMLVKVATDNRNRTLAEFKNLLNKNGGKFLEGGGIRWQFKLTGMLKIALEKDSDESLELSLIEKGVEDFERRERELVAFSTPENLKEIQQQLEQEGFFVKQAELVYLAKNKVELSEKDLDKYKELLAALDDHEDVVAVYDNLKFDQK